MIERAPGTHRRYDLQPGLFLLGLCFMLFGCVRQPAAIDTMDVPPEVSTIVQVPTTTEVAAIKATTLTPTSVPTATPTLPSPARSIPTIGDFTLGRDFLFEHETPSCQLPCWQGLIVGESDREDVRSVFEDVFGYSGSEDIFTYSGDSGIPGMIALRNSWSPATQLGTAFGVEVIIEESSSILESVSFSWGSNGFVNMSPQRTIEELGEPEYIMTAVPRAGMGKMARVIMTMIYAEGISFDFFYILDIDDKPTEDTVTFCLSQQEELEDGSVTIVQPLVGGLQDLTPVQAAYVTPAIEDFGLHPIEEVFGVGIEEVTQRIQRGEDVCLTATLD
jgi:hypothetical protein